MGSQSKGHAIMISVPYQGHINPFIALALKLASKGFTVTFVHLESVHYNLSKARRSHTSNSDPPDYNFFSKARESGLDIRYTTIGDGFPLEFDRDLRFDEYWDVILRDFPARVHEFVGKIIDQNHSDDLVPFFLVTDTVYAWPQTVSDKYNLVNVSVWTQPALVFSLAYHWDLLTEKGHSPGQDQNDEINYIPGVKSISTKDFMSYLNEPDVGNTMYKAMSRGFDQVKQADFILHNTLQEFESETLSALNRYQPNYAIGPMNFYKNLPTNTVTKSLWSESECTHWLKTKPPGSVLYVSFGSFVHTSKGVIEELAYGLLLSGVNFIWAVRDGILGSGDGNVLPIGFRNESKDKGLIVPWCDQISVLSNIAVGGFLTHNGWNSTMESMWCGVPMICYPIACDQPTNRKLVVSDWEIGISLCDDGMLVDRTEVAKKIKSFMSDGVSSRGLRARMDKVKGVLRKAVEIDGSSEKNFDQFTKDCEAKIHAKACESRRKLSGDELKMVGHE